MVSYLSVDHWLRLERLAEVRHLALALASAKVRNIYSSVFAASVNRCDLPLHEVLYQLYRRPCHVKACK